MNNQSKFYDGGQMLSYKKHVNFLLGHRSTGKTFWAKKRAVQKFLTKGKGSVWVRRYKTELKGDKLKKFFQDLISANCERAKQGKKLWFPLDTEFEVRGYVGYINKKPAIAFIPLSVATTFKSVPFEECDDIYFDEFLVDKQHIRYLQNEVEMFFEFFLTVMRERFDDVFVYFIGNAISVVNPYFLFFGIKMSNKEFTFDKTGEVLVQNFKSEQIIQEFKNSWFGRLMQGTSYFEYAVENEFLRDNNEFIEQRSKNAIFRCAIYYKKCFYGFWVDFKTGLMYASEKYDPSSLCLYTLTREDHSVNLLLIKNKKNTFIEEVLFEFQTGALRFESQKVKQNVFELLSFFFR